MDGQPLRILILGASYGLLPGVKLGLAGYRVTFVGRADEVSSLTQSGLKVSIPLRRSDDVVTLGMPIGADAAPGTAAAITPDVANPADHDFFILAMQEPQYRDPAVAALMGRIAATERPCLSIMNLPPRCYLERIESLDPAAFAGVYASDAVWQKFARGKMSVTSPDAQAVRLDPAKPGELSVTLPSNFKAAPFADPQDQLLLETVANAVSRLNVAHRGASIRPPVSMVAKSSLFTPLAKWPMLLSGNYRCLTPDGTRSIADAVLTDEALSRAIFGQVFDLLIALGASPHDLVDFDSYRQASAGLTRPSSLARALSAGAVAVERVDRLVANLMHLHGMVSGQIDEIVAGVDEQLSINADRLRTVPA